MQREEFESLTGISPTLSMYAVIEKEYMKSKMDKTEFCHVYALNIDGIAERIQRLADQEEIDRIRDFECRIAELQAQLDKEREANGMSVPKKRILELAIDKLESELHIKCKKIASGGRELDLSTEFYELKILLTEWEEMKNELVFGPEKPVHRG